jgi:hypothetical protein
MIPARTTTMPSVSGAASLMTTTPVVPAMATLVRPTI